MSSISPEKCPSTTTRTFRVTNIPSSWGTTKFDSVLRQYFHIDRTVGKYRLKIHPSVKAGDDTQVALLTVTGPREYVDGIAPGNGERVVNVQEEGDKGKVVQITVDREFCGLTPMNHPEGEAVAE